MVGGQVKKRVCSCKYLIYRYILKLYSYNFINTCCNITYKENSFKWYSHEGKL